MEVSKSQDPKACQWDMQNFQIYTEEIQLIRKETQILTISPIKQIMADNVFKNTVIINPNTYKQNSDRHAQYKNKFQKAYKDYSERNTNNNKLVIIFISKQSNIDKQDITQEIDEINKIAKIHNASIIVKFKQENQDEQKIADIFKKYNPAWT